MKDLRGSQGSFISTATISHVFQTKDKVFSTDSSRDYIQCRFTLLGGDAGDRSMADLSLPILCLSRTRNIHQCSDACRNPNRVGICICTTHTRAKLTLLLRLVVENTQKDTALTYVCTEVIWIGVLWPLSLAAGTFTGAMMVYDCTVKFNDRGGGCSYLLAALVLRRGFTEPSCIFDYSKLVIALSFVNWILRAY